MLCADNDTCFLQPVKLLLHLLLQGIRFWLGLVEVWLDHSPDVCTGLLEVPGISFCQFHCLGDLQCFVKGETPFRQEALLNPLFICQTRPPTSLEKCHSLSSFETTILVSPFLSACPLSQIIHSTMRWLLGRSLGLLFQTRRHLRTYRQCLTTPLHCLTPSMPVLFFCLVECPWLVFSLHLRKYVWFKCHNSLALPYLSTLFQEPSHRYSTWNSNLVNLPPVKSCYGQHSLSFLGVSYWRSLPLSIHNSDSLVTLTPAASAFYYLTWLLVYEHLHGHQSTTAWQQTYYYYFSTPKSTHMAVFSFFVPLLSVQFSVPIVVAFG